MLLQNICLAENNANLDNDLNQLVEKGPNSGFYKTTAGEKSDKIYCLVQCREDVSAANCANCTNQTVTVAVQDCPKSKTFKVCFTWCYLQYSDQPFFNVGDKPSAAIYNCTNADVPTLITHLLHPKGRGMVWSRALGILVELAAASVGCSES
ncbi:hypothetical protein SLEP1_g54488 [Rubroshorea leprosula]|uniref:Gnk2-homologous domain-containing protein n=1 Tax=Rubroshorea leprosula TaxID=152421 RepID=A0AAV5MCT4_9ROSI|nr:hypothetical protein SLEP1_g54488 [Rubroshorea leprosula]